MKSTNNEKSKDKKVGNGAAGNGLVRLSDWTEKWLQKVAASAWFAVVLLVLAVASSVYWPFDYAFIILTILLVVYPIVAYKKDEFKRLLLFWYFFTFALLYAFIITIFNPPLALAFSCSVNTHWGVF